MVNAVVNEINLLYANFYIWKTETYLCRKI
jgi:hypothetical protein